jgi:ABC-type glycerol-3-phosphate transport system permease component
MQSEALSNRTGPSGGILRQATGRVLRHLTLQRLIVYVLLLILAGTYVFPLFWVGASSLKSQSDFLLNKELLIPEEAAVIDGANAFQIFQRVMLPLSRPGLVTVAIFNILGNWNEYDLALVLLQDDSVRTIPIGIARLFVQQGFRSDFGALFAGLVIVMVPTLLIYAVFSEKFIEGLTIGALK